MGLYSQSDKSHTIFGSNFSQPASWIVNQGDRCTLRVTFLTSRHHNFAALVPQRNPFGDVSGIPSRRAPLRTKEMQVLNATPKNHLSLPHPVPETVAPAQSDRRSTPLGGCRRATYLLFFGQLLKPRPNQSIVVTSAGRSSVKIGNSRRTSGLGSKSERTMTRDQNLPTDHYSNRLFRHILLPLRVLRKMV